MRSDIDILDSEAPPAPVMGANALRRSAPSSASRPRIKSPEIET
jgi:hypothetical protein